jgi:gliding motility-associated-like protein
MMSGFYTVSATDQNGCSSKAVVHVTVSSMPQATLTSNSPVCENGQITFAALGASSNFIYSWSGPDNFTSNLQLPSIAPAPLTAAGSYSLSLTNGPCVNTFITPVVVHALPVITIQGGADVCETKTISLSASATGVISSWLWAGKGNFFTSFPSFSRSPADPSMAGVYTITAMNAFGCFNYNTISVQVLPNPTVTVSDMTVCLNAPAVFSAKGAASYLWTGPGGFVSPLSQPTLASASSPGKQYYTVTGTAANSCTSTAVLALSTRALPLPSFTVSPSPGVCEGQSITLSGSGGVSYRWDGPDHLFFAGQQVTLLMRSTAFAGDYILTVTDSSNCHNSVQKTIPVYPLPDGNLSGKMEGCVPLCSDYSMSVPANVTAVWKINGKQAAASSFTWCFTKAQTYTIGGIFTDSTTNCKNSVTYYVDVHSRPDAQFSYEPLRPIEKFDEVKFTPVTISGENRYSWYNDQVQGVSGTSDIYSSVFENEGYYQVALVVESSKGCVDTVVKAVHIEPGFNVYVPNAFTPNGDEYNGTFKPVTRGVVHYHLQIFNRWGMLLFETNDQQQGWDGTYKGKNCKEDVYVYQLSISDDRQQRFLTGHLTLTR